MEITPKKLLAIPVVLFIFSVSILLYNFYHTGNFFLLSIDLRGGTLITLQSSSPINTNLIQSTLGTRYGSVLVSGLTTTNGYGANIEVGANEDTTSILNTLGNAGVQTGSVTIESVGPELGSLFLQQIFALWPSGRVPFGAIPGALILMSIVIFILYRKFVSSFAIVFAVLANILTTLAVSSLLGIEISFAGFAGLLMLIAYTVDTNIVLTTKVLRTTPEEFRKKYRLALTTGLTLIATITITMIAVVFLSASTLLINVAEVLVIGFLSDLPFTWIMNAGLLEMHVHRSRITP